ncbi:hypothetical protein [Acanthopleuribacter pedis]|uniref:Uncharacterized protein n=1 Tax=Acanthopleuribacter pedis TaxID=442870 RepID=A0A8J7QEU3_9BACT|nr:hypothetical protein [Acanthopleuribacter pedis]MBO1322684.1 hypothetical protein [Acanthopleuribacter pedis]
MPIKTLVPRAAGQYSAFPTCVTVGDSFYLFYRQGQKGKWGTHGFGGTVQRAAWNKAALLTYLEGQTDSCPEPQTATLFGKTGHNEMDAIVSPLGETTSLATRYFDKNRGMFSFVSFSRDLSFPDRQAVTVPGLHWFVFYGKAFVHGDDFLFPAYGGTKPGVLMEPFLLATKRTQPGAAWRVFAAPASGTDTLQLNESSLCFFENTWHLFSRKHGKPFALYHTTSPDLNQWSKPVEWQSHAHAPMAVVFENRVYLSYRTILSDENEEGCEAKPVAGTALSRPFEDAPDLVLDTFPGNIYDGGYSDITQLDGRLLVVYYHGNTAGEPYLRAWLQDKPDDWTVRE